MRHETPQLNQARQFSSWAHTGQTRKYSGEPYFVHPCDVVQILMDHGFEEKTHCAALCAAYLHDVVEDTRYTIEDITAMYGDEIATLVMWLTNPAHKAHGNRDLRKRIDRSVLVLAPDMAKNIKLADIISNTRTVLEDDPEFASTYLLEKLKMVDISLQLEEDEYGLMKTAYAQLHDQYSKLLAQQ